MQTQHIWKPFQKHTIVRFVVKVSIAAVGLLLAGTTVQTSLQETQAKYLGSCSTGDRTYLVVAGDTLDTIAARYDTNRSILATYNHITNANTINTRQLMCIPRTGSTRNPNPNAQDAQTTPTVLAHARHAISHGPVSSGISQAHAEPASSHAAADQSSRQALADTAAGPPVGHTNVFPYGACTWWADQRYYQIHGFFVPWTTQANAAQWVARAYQFGWRVSRFPAFGDILVLQPGVQGAYRLGHVAIVERVLSNGDVIASSMSWGSHPRSVTYWEFTLGPGVAFVTR